MKLKSLALSMFALCAANPGRAAEPAAPATKPAAIGPVQAVECPDCGPFAALMHPTGDISPDLALLLRTQDLTAAIFGTPTTQPAVPENLRPPTALPTTLPAASVKALITQLGDDSPKIREAAHDQLASLGKPVLPALQEARKADDPQIRTSADALIAEIAEKEKPSVAISVPSGVTVFGNGRIRIQQMGMVNVQGGGQIQMEAVVNGQGMRDMTVNENGFKVHIHEDNNGLKMDVTEKGGTKEYAAKNAAELKEKEPEAFKIYEKYSVQNVKIEIVPERAPRD